MLNTLQMFGISAKNRINTLVDFEKYLKALVCVQRSLFIQPTSNYILLKCCGSTIASSCDAHRSVRLQLFLRCFELFENTCGNILRGFPSRCQHFLLVELGRDPIVVWCISAHYFPYSYDMFCWKFCNTSTTFPNVSIVWQRSISLDVPLVTCVL